MYLLLTNLNLLYPTAITEIIYMWAQDTGVVICQKQYLGDIASYIKGPMYYIQQLSQL